MQFIRILSTFFDSAFHNNISGDCTRLDGLWAYFICSPVCLKCAGLGNPIITVENKKWQEKNAGTLPHESAHIMGKWPSAGTHTPVQRITSITTCRCNFHMFSSNLQEGKIITVSLSHNSEVGHGRTRLPALL